MKTKKFVSLILALLMVLTLFSGCKEEASAETTEHSFSGEVPNIVNGVYATCENYDFTIYKGSISQPYFEFYLVCKDALPNDAAITVPNVEAVCEATITECTPRRQTVNREIYMFLQQPDMDWAAYYTQYDYLKSESERLAQLLYGDKWQQGGEYDDTQGVGKEYREAYEAWTSFREAYATETEAYNDSKQKPEYHLYRVKILIREASKREQLKSLSLSAGEMSREITLKDVWVDTSKITGSGGLTAGAKLESNLQLPATRVHPDGSGYCLISDYFPEEGRAAGTPWSTETTSTRLDFIAQADIQLKSVYSWGDNSQIKVEWVDMVIVDNKNKAITTRWVPGTDMLIRFGEKVAMNIHWTDPDTNQANYAMNTVFVMEYELNGNTRRIAKQYLITRSLLSAPELYLWAFLGMDFESFYREYANKNEDYIPFTGII